MSNSSDRPLFYDGGSPETKKQQKLKMLYEQHGYKIHVPKESLNKEDRSPKWGGRLRCFKMIHVRDDLGNKTHQISRCKNPTEHGSLFCKKHNGANINAVVHGKGVAQHLYKGAFQNEVGTLFEAFLNDPSIYDLKPELAALKTALRKYIEDLSEDKPIKNSKQMLKTIKIIMSDKMYSPNEKIVQVRDIIATQLTLTDGDALDRVARIIETISKIVDRLTKAQSKDEFILTPDGIKIMFRCIIDIIRSNVAQDKLENVKKALMDISIRTKGDLRSYSDSQKIINITPNNSQII